MVSPSFMCLCGEGFPMVPETVILGMDMLFSCLKIRPQCRQNSFLVQVQLKNAMQRFKIFQSI